MLYEALLLTAVFFFGFFIPQSALGVLTHVVLPSGLLLTHAILLTAAYFLWFWRRDGRTLAMQTWKIRLRAKDGTAPSFDRLLLRFMLAWPSVLLFGVGLAWAVVDRDRQFLHDRLAGTRLVMTG